MRVVALQTGFYGSLRLADDIFEVPDDAKATWFVPVDPPKPPERRTRAAPKPADDEPLV